MECDLDNVYEKIKGLFPRIFGAIPDDFKYVGGILQQIPPYRARKMLIPIINNHNSEGTSFDSDSWKA